LREAPRRILPALIIAALLVALPLSYTPRIEYRTVCACSVSSSAFAKSLPIPPGLVWSENFDDLDISDWNTPFGINYTAVPAYVIPANISLTGGVLRMLSPGGEVNMVGYNISVGYGTWIFDVDIQNPLNYASYAVAFMVEAFHPEWLISPYVANGYGIGFRLIGGGPDGTIYLQRETRPGGGGGSSTTLDSQLVDDILGWQNIIVTRNESGQFYVYLNEQLVLEWVDSTHTTLDQFLFWGGAGPAIDNITVYDTVIFDKVAPKWVGSIADQTCVAGTPFVYDLDATDDAGLDAWWVNDTSRFTIDGSGTVTNIINLEVGDYGIGVSVNDTFGNVATAAFKLTVGAVIPGFPLPAILVGTAAALWLGLVRARSRRRRLA
jgi:hypothetical protein